MIFCGINGGGKKFGWLNETNDQNELNHLNELKIRHETKYLP